MSFVHVRCVGTGQRGITVAGTFGIGVDVDDATRPTTGDPPTNAEAYTPITGALIRRTPIAGLMGAGAEIQM